MKPNTIVLLEHAGLIRIGVVTRRITAEALDHTSTNCEVRLSNQPAPTRVETSELVLTDLDALMKEDQHSFMSNPALHVLWASDELKRATKYQAEKAVKPSEDPDDIPF